jgi:tRNA(fMet)-specific endonuclease VapC
LKVLLDTNALSALMMGDPLILERLVILRRSDVLAPQPAIAEILYGIARLPASRRRRELEARFELVRAELGVSLWDDRVSESFGSVKAALEASGQLIEDFDIAIAAHALSQGAVLLSDNLRHMQRVPGLQVETWLPTR